mgnify:CR=1 FL=1
MGIADTIATQFAKPHGALAPLTAVALNIGNRRINRLTIEALELKPGESVLEVGFGGGEGLRRALRGIAPNGRAVRTKHNMTV